MTTKIKSNYIGIVDTAKLVRQILKEKFPDCKFSVKSHKYAGGGSINIRYIDYLPSSEIEKVVKHFGGKSFDSMNDYTTYESSIEVTPTGELVENNYGSDYVFVHRDYSEKYNWLLCNKLDLRTKPNLMDQFHCFLNNFNNDRGYIPCSSIKVDEIKIVFDLDTNYDSYRVNSSLECLNKQGYKTEVIKEENNYKVIIYKF